MIIKRQRETSIKSILYIRAELNMKTKGINIAIAPINNKFLLSSASAKAGDTDNVIMIKFTSLLLNFDLSITINRTYTENVLKEAKFSASILDSHYNFVNNNFLIGIKYASLDLMDLFDF